MSAWSATSLADATEPDESIAKLERDIAIDRALYTGARSGEAATADDCISRRHSELGRREEDRRALQSDVEYWSRATEPNFGAGPEDFLEKELKPFYETIKSVSPKLKVIGPGTVSYNVTMFPWIEGS